MLDVRAQDPSDRSYFISLTGGPFQAESFLAACRHDQLTAPGHHWTLDPFTFVEQDGYYYGRGTSDDKDEAAIHIANLIRLKQEGFQPDRDIIVALTADEEGGTDNGVQWLLANHRDLIDAEYALNEGGGGAMQDGRRISNAVQASEKVYQSFALGGYEPRRSQFVTREGERNLPACRCSHQGPGFQFPRGAQ